MRRVLYIVGVIVLAYGSALAVIRLTSGEPRNPGVQGERLAGCPTRPNCVSSSAESEGHRIAPLRFEGSAADAMTGLEAVLREFPGIEIVTRDGGYLHAEATTTFFRFVDDLEFHLDSDEGVIHVRSASRIGYSDLGVNRKRMERIRSWFSTSSPAG